MTDSPDAGSGDYTTDAQTAILAAAAPSTTSAAGSPAVLATVAADLGSTHALVANRPGSWEAEHVRGLVNGTVGWDEDTWALQDADWHERAAKTPPTDDGSALPDPEDDADRLIRALRPGPSGSA